MTRLCVLLAVCLFQSSPAWSQSDAGEALSEEVAEVESPSKWAFSLRPYFFLLGVSGSVTVDPLTVPINSKFSDLLDNVRIGGFIAFTAEKGQWGVYADFQYISLIGQGHTSLEAELELENLIGEADVTFRPGRAGTLKFLAGVRIYSVQQTLSINGEPLPSVTTTVFDPILGAQGSWTLGDRWDFQMRGDIGGFGVSSEFTYQLLTLFSWDISNSVSLPFGYRILGYQIKDGDVWMNTRMSGLVLGLDFRF